MAGNDRKSLCNRCLSSAIILTTLLTTVTSETPKNTTVCRDGLLLPVWCPQENLSSGDIVARGIVYFVALVYMFVGVSIVAEKFMASIEVITSKEKEVVIKKPNGQTQTISVRIWNETVSNLTLMALGSSAPEILLSIIEVYAQNFQAGQLGPGTIVGSAAFNMFVIIAICVWSVPSEENRRIKHLRVFFVTMTWSVFAYIWLYIILKVISPRTIDVWEGILTFMFFPATVLTAYIADRRLLIYKYLTKKYHVNKRGLVVAGEGEDLEMGIAKANHIPDGNVKSYETETSDDLREFEEHRMEYIQILRELRRKHPDADMEDIEMMAREEILNRGPKSRAYYRIQATRKLMGGTNLMKRKLERVERKEDEDVKDAKRDIVSIYFDPGHYTVMENVGQFAVTVAREGGALSESVAIDYKTEDGTANAGSDYYEAVGTLIFGPGESQKQFMLTVIDDDVFEEDEHFYVRLLNPRYTIDKTDERIPIELATPHLATVMILDDDHAGIFLFPEAELEIAESVGMYKLLVNRFSGARGKVFVPFRTVDGTAKAGADFERVEGELMFENNETSKEIPLGIIDNESYEKEAVFYVELGKPKLEEDFIRQNSGEDMGDDEDESALSEDEKIALLGKPRLGEQSKVRIRIKESREFKNTVDKLFQRANITLSIGTSSWREQFIEAITVSAGDDSDGGDDGEEGGAEKEPKLPTCTDYVFHFITLFWKLIFAFIPPADLVDGWVCFVFSILCIGGLTAVIGDLASHFGCTVGLEDTVTAVALVALGTSVPDTFASKVAAIQDKYADSSIGNVTGSNAVNVFLGIGVAWSIAAIYHYAKGSVFEVDPGTLAFSVTMFCVFAAVVCAVLMLRRHKKVGGELGGPMRYKVPTTILFVSLWLLYVIISSLEAYGIVQGF